MKREIAGYVKLSAKERLAESKVRDEQDLMEKEEAKQKIAKKAARLKALRLSKQAESNELG